MPEPIVAASHPHVRRSARAIVALLACAVGLACATVAPKALSDARDAYSRAAEGPAVHHNLAQLRMAQKALLLAEQTFDEEGDTRLTRDRALGALREAQLATAMGEQREAPGAAPLSNPSGP